MNKILIISFITLLACSCSKDPILTKQKTPGIVCGTPGWPQGIWDIKYEITGTAVPDSIHWSVNAPPNNSYSYRRRLLPTLPIIDSTTYCGDLNSDICIFLFDHDTTNIYTCKIYVNSVLKTSVTGKSPLPPDWLFAVAGCQ